MLDDHPHYVQQALSGARSTAVGVAKPVSPCSEIACACSSRKCMKTISALFVTRPSLHHGWDRPESVAAARCLCIEFECASARSHLCLVGRFAVYAETFTRASRLLF